MEITPKNNITNIDTYINQIQAKQKIDATPEKADTNVAKTDTVEISETARQIQEAKRQLDTIPDVETDKVHHLRSQIEKGTYSIKSEEIAEKMLKESLFNDLF